jgi:hypothetical protein
MVVRDVRPVRRSVETQSMDVCTIYMFGGQKKR